MSWLVRSIAYNLPGTYTVDIPTQLKPGQIVRICLAQR
jgi:hypothetical protein